MVPVFGWRGSPTTMRMGVRDGKSFWQGCSDNGCGAGSGPLHALRLAEEGADVIAIDICESVGTTP